MWSNNPSSMDIFLQGWRFAFYIVAALAATTAVINLLLGHDPRPNLHGVRCLL